MIDSWAAQECSTCGLWMKLLDLIVRLQATDYRPNLSLYHAASSE